MSSPVTLSQMILAVRRRANIESQTGFITEAELTEYLNYCCSDLYDRLVQAGGQEWFRRSPPPFLTNSTDDTYPLPPDFYRLTSVDVTISTNVVLTARPFMEEERNRYKWYPGWLYDRPIFYRLVGMGNIRFVPAPSGTFTVGLNYYPVFQKMVQQSDTFEGINGWEEEPIWRAVAYAKAKGDEDPSFAMARVQELQGRIDALAQTRDATGPERVHDVDVGFMPWGY